jgi:hypothetical protein
MYDTQPLCKSCIIKISSRSQVNKSNENHYPSDDITEIVAVVMGKSQHK